MGKRKRRTSHLLHEQALGPFLQNSGTATIPVPPNAPASFETQSRRVVWEIVMKATIAGRPDISEAFRFWVTGQR
jgi:hypothetical protein